MRTFLLSLACVLAFSGLLRAQGNEIEGVITRQLDAFRADDFATAFTFASPSIRGMFGTAENFGRMVTQGYPMVWRPADVEYLGLREERGTLAQRVQIVDAEGRLHLLDYFMIETVDGWKINGVQFVEADAQSV